MSKPADRTFLSRSVPGRAWALSVALAFLAAAPGCQQTRSFKERLTSATGKVTGSNFDDPMAEAKLKDAEELFYAGQYDKAVDQFHALADNKGNSAELAEKARFLEAECKFMMRQFPRACDTYHKVLLDFPHGVYRRDCCTRMFDICDYWLNDFREELARRSEAGETGVLRWRPKWPEWSDPTKPRVDQEGHALESLVRVHSQYPTGPTADKALFWCGYVNFIRGNFQEADQFFSQLESMHPDSPLRPQAMALAIQAKNNATGGAEYDGRRCAEALNMIQRAEATVPEIANDPEMKRKLERAKFAIRSQQAEKDFLVADYYARTGHPGSAVFYYELVRRRYAGTRYAEMATERQAYLVEGMKQGRPDPGTDPFAVAKAKFNELFGKTKPPDEEEKDRVRDPSVAPAGGPLVPPGAGTGPLQP